MNVTFMISKSRQTFERDYYCYHDEINNLGRNWDHQAINDGSHASNFK